MQGGGPEPDPKQKTHKKIWGTSKKQINIQQQVLLKQLFEGLQVTTAELMCLFGMWAQSLSTCRPNTRHIMTLRHSRKKHEMRSLPDFSAYSNEDTKRYDFMKFQRHEL